MDLFQVMLGTAFWIFVIVLIVSAIKGNLNRPLDELFPKDAPTKKTVLEKNRVVIDTVKEPEPSKIELPELDQITVPPNGLTEIFKPISWDQYYTPTVWSQTRIDNLPDLPDAPVNALSTGKKPRLKDRFLSLPRGRNMKAVLNNA